MEIIRETNIATLSIDIQWLKNDLKKNEELLATSQDCYTYGGEKGDMLFWVSYISLYIKARKCDIKKFKMLQNAPKDKPLNHNTIKAAKICNSIIKTLYIETLDLCSEAVIAGHITEQWYLNKANYLNIRIGKNENEDKTFYK